MATLTEGPHTGEFVVSEANAYRSRDEDTLAIGQNLEAGAVLGRLTGSGNLTAYDNGAVDGSETAVAILYGAVDATAAATACTVIARDAEVNLAELVFDAGQDQAAQDAAIDDLRAVGIIARRASG